MPSSFTFNVAGTYTIEDDGIRGNNMSRIRHPDGTVIDFVHPGDSIDFLATVPGVTLVFNVLDSFGTANVNVGSLTSSAMSPDFVVIRQLRTDSFISIAANAQISEGGNDAAADLSAAGVVLSALTGVGTPANAIETQTLFIEAETVSGGINIVNAGNVQIGGLTPEVQGLFVLDSGDINLTTTGFILLNDATGPSSVRGGDLGGNVSLTALGAQSDIFTTLNAPLVSAAGGGITLVAGRDIRLGTAGMNFDNDILATTFVDIRAGQDFVLDGNANIRTGAFGGVVGGPIAIRAARDIVLDNVTGGLETIESFAGDLTLTAGPGGSFIEAAALPGAVRATGGAIIVNADRMLIISGGLNVVTTEPIFLRPVTPGRAIDLGTALESSAALGLSDAELDLMFTVDLRIGDANSGPVDISGPISPNVVPTALTVTSGTEILVRSSITLDSSLTLIAGDDIFFTSAASLTTTSRGFSALVDQAQDDGGVGGVASLGGTFNVATTIALSGNGDSDSLNGSSSGETIQGLGGNDLLNGLGGNDTLIGGAGNDSMSGGPGDDIFSVDSALDLTIEVAGEGNDRVLTSVSYALTPMAEIELLATGNQAATTPINLTGNPQAQSIIGNDGVNSLSGLGGNDTLFGNGGNDSFDGGTGADVNVGGLGDDVFLVDGADSVLENAGQGNDRVLATASYALTSGSEVELIAAADQAATTALDIVGNNLPQTIIGNAGVNRLAGAGGADALLGLGGNDVLDGGAGVDQLNGGSGDDVYAVDNAGDLVFETAGNGSDRVLASVSYALGAGVEVELMATPNQSSVAPLDLTGNELANNIQANNGTNLLRGLGGNDVLFGLGGNDTLNGGAGVDQLTGGAGADNHVFADALGATNIDLVFGFVSGSDKIQLDDSIFTAFAPGALPAGALRLGTSAVDANDRILYDQATGRLFYDPDATGVAAPVHFATLSGNPVIAESDFAVI